eukprot:2344465-Alexandrium_andersonii.AAC.1
MFGNSEWPRSPSPMASGALGMLRLKRFRVQQCRLLLLRSMFDQGTMYNSKCKTALPAFCS